MFDGQTILITGGTGSWGRHLVWRLIQGKPKEVRILSRNEFAQVQMQRDFADVDTLRFIIGDVRDPQAVDEACKEVDTIFHLAALKHVPICESQPEEALKTNVIGTQNVIRSAIRHGVAKVVDVSTDKAVDPVNFYGMTKAFGERLTIHSNNLPGDTRFVCIRGGNVLGTNGSVVPFFRSRLRNGQTIPLTSKEMTRFFLTVDEAIQLLLKAAHWAQGGETFVIRMRSCRILDLIHVLAQHHGKPGWVIQETGIRPGEKLHEVLVSHYESPNTHQISNDFYVILHPTTPSQTVARYCSLPRVRFRHYSSDQELMKPSEIEQLLSAGGLLS